MLPQPVSFSDAEILRARGPRNPADPWQPYHFLVEPEYSADDTVDDVATIFLTGCECPFTCLMCDLWKNTTREAVPAGAIPAQIEFALRQLPPARHIKLYNSSNFFDRRAVPTQDLPQIAQQVGRFRTVIVENHPKLCGPACAEFQQQCGTQLEVALGLETSHAPTLAALNKQMTVADFSRACRILLQDRIRIRAFVLLRPPGVSEEQGVRQAIDSVKFAFDCGVSCCSVIPVRSGNGILELLQRQGQYTPPTLRSLVTVCEETLGWGRGRVQADLWDLERLATCPECRDAVTHRLRAMNLTQRVPPAVTCSRCDRA